MKSAYIHWIVLVFVAGLCRAPMVLASQAGWQRQGVDWRMTGGRGIKAIYYPQGKIPPLFSKQSSMQPRVPGKKVLTDKASSRLGDSTYPIIASVIESPPVDGFIPWIVVSVTDARLGEFELDAVPQNSVVGDYLTGSPESDYIIGLFDTGATVHIMGSINAERVGIFDAELLTSNEIELIGVTGSAFAWVSHPLGIFIDGLGAIEPNGLILDTSGMKGESNVSILVREGDGGLLENHTAVGSPLSVYFTAAIYNDRQVSIIYDGNEYTGPDIRFYEEFDPCIPSYSNSIPLELRPTGAVAVQYWPNFDPENYEPITPSMITAFLPTQSLFFVSSVDLTHKGKNAIDKDGFIFDTGAQVTVISEAIAARLNLNPANPDFEVEILDVTGEVTIQPGFYIDSLEIIATPEWLSFTNVPVIMLDAPSPEGGTLDGIIGMNLFIDFNLVFQGGGLPDMGGHRVYFEPIPFRIVADIAPEGGDGVVDYLDLAAFADAWLAIPGGPNWNQRANMAPYPVADGKINFLDFVVFAEHWREAVAP